MHRNNSQKGRYSKRKGQKEELHIAKMLTKWAKKDYGPTSTFMRTYSSGSMSARTLAPGAYLISDVYATGLVSHFWCFNIEAKCYNSTSLRRYYEGTTRLQSWLLEVTRDTLKHLTSTVPMLVTHINRFRDMVLIPYQSDFFKEMNKHNYPAWSSYESFKIPRTGHIYKFHVILTDLQSIIKCLSCRQFIKMYHNLNWDKMNSKYSKYHTESYLQKHSRKDMSTVSNTVRKTLNSVKK